MRMSSPTLEICSTPFKQVLAQALRRPPVKPQQVLHPLKIALEDELGVVLLYGSCGTSDRASKLTSF